jgi:hypothetical protein
MMLKEALKKFFLKNRTLSIFLMVFTIILLGLRFVWLDKFPVGINHDEIDVILSAKSYYKFGTDLSGVRFPISLFSTRTEAGLAGLPSFLTTFIYGPFATTTTSARIPAVLLSIIIIFLTSYLLFVTTQNIKLFLISLFVGMLAPWLYFYSRAPTESPWALLFLLLGLILFLSKEKFNQLLSVILLIMSFYSYQGAKVTIPILAVLLIVAAYIKRGIKLSSAVLYVSIFLVSSGLFFVYSFKQGSTYDLRQREIIFEHMDKYEMQTNELRRDSITTPIQSIFFNKYTLLIHDISKKYVGFFSTDLLFFKGDEAVPFQEHGILLLPDLLFIFMGIVYLGTLTKSKNADYLKTVLAIMIFTAPLASSISVNFNQYLFRGFAAIPALIILISMGIYYLVSSRKALIAVVAVVYISFFLNFLHFFFFRYSISQQENHYLSERVLASYLKRVGDLSSRAFVLSEKPHRPFYEYIFFNNLFHNLTQTPEIKASFYDIDNIVFTQDCDHIDLSAVAILPSNLSCDGLGGQYLAIQNKKDTGTQFRIYNDEMCEGLKLDSYRRFHAVSDYEIERVDNKLFCERWIGRYE